MQLRLRGSSVVVTHRFRLHFDPPWPSVTIRRQERSIAVDRAITVRNSRLSFAFGSFLRRHVAMQKRLLKSETTISAILVSECKGV